MQRIAFVLNSTLKKFNYETKLKEYHVLSLWAEVVGEFIARHTQPEKIKRRKLFVSVASTAWLNELESMKQMIIERLNSEVKSEVIRDIHFNLSQFSKSNSTDSVVQHVETMGIEIDKDYLEDIKRSLIMIKDPQIRESLNRLMIKDARLRKIREDQKFGCPSRS
ncbi:MAG: DUF721 domain-containing protein [Thermodesulfobacteriota bacterium]|nr:DUF721 domain-containing protein [Thermodesulfobacteriota bacterium]